MQKAVRPCMLSFYFHPNYSGSAVQAQNLSRHLQSRGVLPSVVSANLSASSAFEEVRGLPVFRLPLLQRRDLAIPSFSLSLALFLLKHRRSFDVFHAHGTLQHIAASVMGRMLGKPSILKIAMADSDIAFHRQGRLWGAINSFFVRRFDCFIATSRQVFDELLEKKIPRERIRLIPNGVDTRLFRPAASEAEKQSLRAQLQLPQKPIVCFVGIIDERKNVDGVLRVWYEARQRGADGHLALVGPIPQENGQNSAYYRQLQQFIADNGLRGHVTFTGRTAQVADYLRCSDIFLFPSKREGMPNVLLEAMASGLPCVSSAIGGSVDLIRHGETGYLIELQQEPACVSIVTELLFNPQRAESIGRAAREFVERNLSLDAIADRYVFLYDELLNRLHDGAK